MAVIIDGKAVSARVKENIKAEVATLQEKGISIALAVVLVGEDPASKIYVRNKKIACETVGIQSKEFLLPESTSEDELIQLIQQLNEDPEINGILVQLPLPKQIREQKILESISPIKDVDAFHPVNVGKIMTGAFDFLPCTPAGCMELLHSAGIAAEGKRCVVIGRSNIVGKPMAMLLLHEHGTVTICHSKTPNLAEICLSLIHI